MKKTIRLTERDLSRIVRLVINEIEENPFDNFFKWLKKQFAPEPKCVQVFKALESMKLTDSTQVPEEFKTMAKDTMCFSSRTSLREKLAIAKDPKTRDILNKILSSAKSDIGNYRN